MLGKTAAQGGERRLLGSQSNLLPQSQFLPLPPQSPLRNPTDPRAPHGGQCLSVLRPGGRNRDSAFACSLPFPPPVPGSAGQWLCSGHHGNRVQGPFLASRGGCAGSWSSKGRCHQVIARPPRDPYGSEMLGGGQTLGHVRPTPGPLLSPCHKLYTPHTYSS